MANHLLDFASRTGFQLLTTATSTSFLLLSMLSGSAQAAHLRTGTTFSIFTECINDGIALVVGSTPQAPDGWYYATDAVDDSTPFAGSAYEIFGLGIKETSDSLYIALKANLPLNGTPADEAEDGNIGWGDLFITQPHQSFATAMQRSSIMGIRFAAANDSSVSRVGVYTNARAVSVTETNSGFPSLQAYSDAVIERGNQPSLGDLPTNTEYFDSTQSLNSMGAGRFLGDITWLSMPELQAAGFDFGRYGGSQTIAFKVNKSLLTASTPEPDGVGGLLTLGLTFFGIRQYQQHRQHS